ncbi:hypothetical protein MASR1M74_05800 [Lentimicrobium sp.]
MKEIDWQTPAIDGYGKIKFYPQSRLLPTNDHEYKLLFNISSNKTKQGVNAALWRMARALNLFKASGIDAGNVKLAAIVHGKAYALALSDEKHLEIKGKPNPNLDLLEKLVNNDVKIYVCGQSIAGNKLHASDVNQFVDITLSALMAFPYFADQAYTLIP